MFITIVDNDLNPCIYIPESDDKSYNKSDEETGKKTKYKKSESTLKNNISVDRIDVLEESKGLVDRGICVDDGYKQSLACNNNTIRDDRSKQELEPLDEYENKQNNSDKDEFKNNRQLRTAEIHSNKHQKQHIEKNLDDKQDLRKSVVNTAVHTAACANEIQQEIIWSELRDKFHPSLGTTLELERKAFLSGLEEITKGLEGDEKTKAVLINIQKRAKTIGFTYGTDIDTEGVDDHMSTAVEIIADGGKGLDCEDFSSMATFWGQTATDEGYLPKGSEFVIIIGFISLSAKSQHASCVFISPDGDKYIMDGNSFATHDLYTLSEYQQVDDRLNVILTNMVLINLSLNDRVIPVSDKKRGGRYNDMAYEITKNNITVPDDRISVEWLNQQSKSPIDDSISAYDLRDKIYSTHGLSADHDIYKYDFPFNYKQYVLEKHWEEKLNALVKNPEIIAQDISMAALEGSMATAFAMHKRYKVNRRRRNIIKTHKAKEQWLAKKVKNTEMTLKDFKNFGRISDIVDSSYNNKNIASISNIFKSHRSFKTSESFYSLIQDLKALFPEDEQLLNLDKTITEENLKKRRFVEKDLGEVLKKYGISIEYSTDGGIRSKMTDTLRSIDNKKLNSCLCKTVINKKKLYQTLKTKDLMLYDNEVKGIVEDRAKEIDVCFELKNYDNWKIKFITTDAEMKVASAITSIIPILPIDEWSRAMAYYIERQHRSQNLTNMKDRIQCSQECLEEHKQFLNSEDYSDIKDYLDNVRKLKNRHIKLKIRKANGMCVIQIITACAKITTDPFGPLASVGRNITKGSLKITNSICSMVKRHRGDNAQMQSGNFHTVKDVYQLYKKVYLEAKRQEGKVRSELDEANKKNDCGTIHKSEVNNYMKRMGLIEDLAKKSFGLTRSQFQQLIKTLMVENDRFKLSFSKPL
ncbi:MAG: hypothetical protein KAG53_06435 [Endozoicomonadaceae bacterium]|nr:hypothetical protein [Endozoicomonadaceae bacterium]